MKYVAVKHKPTHTNVWWFSVPEELNDMVHVGAEVLCNTRKGSASGKIEAVMDGLSQSDAEKIIGNHFPLKSLIAVSVDYDMDGIHIPYHIASSNPAPEKISQRMIEFYSAGKFNTPVIFSADGNLRDGYTAYLVAKMFGHDTLHGFCVVK